MGKYFLFVRVLSLECRKISVTTGLLHMRVRTYDYRYSFFYKKLVYKNAILVYFDVTRFY